MFEESPVVDIDPRAWYTDIQLANSMQASLDRMLCGSKSADYPIVNIIPCLTEFQLLNTFTKLVNEVKKEISPSVVGIPVRLLTYVSNEKKKKSNSIVYACVILVVFSYHRLHDMQHWVLCVLAGVSGIVLARHRAVSVLWQVIVCAYRFSQHFI